MKIVFVIIIYLIIIIIIPHNQIALFQGPSIYSSRNPEIKVDKH